MTALLYWIIIKPISLLPYPLLYALSDFFFVVLYYIIPYRKKVVMNNINMALPHLSEAERKEICRKFYRHFCDLVLESLKNFSISDASAQKRMKSLNPEVMNAYAQRGEAVILVGGHYCNWELWAVAAPQKLQHKVLAIYKKLSNAFFDAKMRETRGKFGLHLVATKKTAEYFKNNLTEVNATVFAIDQSPANPEKCVWIDFMGIDTATYFGAEKYAKELNRPIIYGFLEKVKRGHYTVRYETVVENPLNWEHGAITQHVNRILEKEIHKNPELWLWSHKRWKHRRPTATNQS